MECLSVVYVDSVFVLNGMIDYLLCLVTARLAGLALRRWRYVLAGLAGGVYAVAVFLPGGAFLGEVPVKLAAGVLLALIAFGGEEKLLRLTLLLFLMACAMAGCILALGLLAGNPVPMVSGIFYTDVDTKVLLIGAAAAYLVLTVVFRETAKHCIGGNLLPMRIGNKGCTVELTALWDSGNSLRDPVSGTPVPVVEISSILRIFPGEVRHILKSCLENAPAEALPTLRRAAPELRPRLLPYQAVGVRGGLLLTVRTDWVEIAGERYEGASIALSPTALGDGYAALWGGQIRKGGRGYGHGTAKAFDTSGIASGGGSSLHRRQRYPAPASGKGAGSGAVGQTGR